MSEHWAIVSGSLTPEQIERVKGKHDIVRVVRSDSLPKGTAYVVDPDATLWTDLVTGQSWTLRDMIPFTLLSTSSETTE